MTSVQPPVCMDCVRLRPDSGATLTCDAFPDGIPDVIIYGGNDHRRAVKGDHGLRFEPIPPPPARG